MDSLEALPHNRSTVFCAAQSEKHSTENSRDARQGTAIPRREDKDQNDLVQEMAGYGSQDALGEGLQEQDEVQDEEQDEEQEQEQE